MVAQPTREGQLFGNYRLERLLGRGSFAEVYLGQHLRLRRPAAIKILHTVFSEQEIEDFQKEAQTIAALDHPNIVRILDFDVQQGIPFLVMDYLPNGTLRQRHKRGECVDLLTVVSYVQQIAAALQYAHDQRLIHRDIKPENMLIGRRGEIVLSDFGMVTAAHGSSSMEQQALAGTAAYIAPEQIQRQAREASDQYALGVVTYEWLCGQRPFEGAQHEVLFKHLLTPPAPFEHNTPGLSTQVEQIVLRALAKDPHQRFPNVQAFATALEQASQALHPAKTGTTSPGLPESTPQLLGTLVAPSTPNSTVDEQKTLLFQEMTSTPPVISVPPITPLPQTPPSSLGQKRRYPRRAILIGLSLGGLVAVSAGVLWEYRTPIKQNIRPPFHPYTYRGHTDVVNTVAWSPDGQFIASGSADGSVRIIKAADGSLVNVYTGHTDSVKSVAWSPDSQRIASGSLDETVHIWNATDGGRVSIYKRDDEGVNSVAWSPDGQRLASGNRNAVIQVWNVTDGSDIYSYRGHRDGVNSVAWSPNGQRIASGSRDTTVQIMNAADAGNVGTYRGHTDDVYTLAWSPDGQRVASGSYDGTIQVWNADNENHASISADHALIYMMHTHMVYAVAWSPDGKHLAASSSENTVQVWNIMDRSHIYVYFGHTGPVAALAWSPDGQHIASASLDKTVQVWSPQ